MLEKEKLKREDVLKLLDIPEDRLTDYEQELEIVSSTDDSIENFTNEDVESIKVLHKLLESGMSKNEVKILASFSEILRNVDIEGSEGIKNLLALSPIYRLKQTLNITRQELDSLKSKALELEGKLLREIESRAQVDKQNILLSAEMETKEKTLENLDKKLSETLLQKAHLESQLAIAPTPDQKMASSSQAQLKGKKSKELYEIIVQKDSELMDLKKKIDELKSELTKSSEENQELSERLEFMEDDISEMEHEVEERYQEQIKTIREQVEGLIDSKQKEWDNFFVKSGEQHKSELLTLQKNHEQEIQRLKMELEGKDLEIEAMKASRNPISGIFKKRK